MTDTCAGLARDLGEPLAGTGPTARGWLLVESPGAWGRDVLTSSSLDPQVGAALAERSADVPVKVLLIRRTRRGGGVVDPPRDAAPAGRTVFLVHTGPDGWCERLTVDDDRALFDLDPAVCAAGRSPGLGARHDEPVLLVCTHGKRDRCCATFGRPVADTLSALHPDLTWECSHLGGHRFAGNLLVLPDGWCYGGLDVAGAAEVVAGQLAGRVDPQRLRGRCGPDRAAQAAEVFLRRSLGTDGIDQVHVAERSVAHAAGHTDHEVTVIAHGRTLLVRVGWRPSGRTRPLSCDAPDPEDPGAYHLVSIRPADVDLPLDGQGRPTPATQLRWSAR